jgi:hypothetical protein
VSVSLEMHNAGDAGLRVEAAPVIERVLSKARRLAGRDFGITSE